jgi:hypothetical protein
MYHLACEVLVNNLVSTLFRSCYGVWLPFSCSWSVWKRFLRKLVTPTVFMCYCRTRAWEEDLKCCWTFTWAQTAFCLKMVGRKYSLFRTAAGWRGRLVHFVDPVWIEPEILRQQSNLYTIATFHYEILTGGYEKLQPAIQQDRHNPLLASQVRMRQHPSYSARQMKPNLGWSRRNRKASLIYRGLCCLFLFLIWPTALMGPTRAQEMQWNMTAESTKELQSIWHEHGYAADTALCY